MKIILMDEKWKGRSMLSWKLHWNVRRGTYSNTLRILNRCLYFVQDGGIACLSRPEMWSKWIQFVKCLGNGPPMNTHNYIFNRFSGAKIPSELTNMKREMNFSKIRRICGGWRSKGDVGNLLQLFVPYLVSSV